MVAKPSPPHVQPWLNDLEVAVRGNVTSLSDRLGDMGATAGTGLFVDDLRVLSLLALTVDEVIPDRLVSRSRGGSTSVLSAVRHVGNPGPDPTVEVVRARELVPMGMTETITVRSRAAVPVEMVLRVRVAGDGVSIASVKGGAPAAEGLPVTITADDVRWLTTTHEVRVRAEGAEVGRSGDGSVVVCWPVRVAPGGQLSMNLTVAVSRSGSSSFDAEPGLHLIDWSRVTVRAQDDRIERLLETSLADLRGLLLADPDATGDAFVAAGTPWYLTLFGRDSLWSARLLLPFGWGLAAGTLRTLARRQGSVEDPHTAQSVGKILHEVRRTSFDDPSSDLHLPPLYFGTVDATPLWVILLHEAWLWGMPPQEIRELRPHLDAALEWIQRSCAESPDGFLRYVDASGTGLANQGWKDSDDSMRCSDGTIADGPIALVETQAYAVDAALRAADLRERIDGESGADLRAFAEDLRRRIHDSFWVDDPAGRYLAMALDGTGRPVDGIGSNMGHVLGSRVLDLDDRWRVARTLTDPDMLGTFGIRTLSAANPAYNPIGYHTGSIWTHDSAIAALGLDRDGFRDESSRVVRALVAAAGQFDTRWPELYSGETTLGAAAPYPASCRPQGWAAASVGALVQIALGLEADVPAGRLRISPTRPAIFGRTEVCGLRVGEAEVRVTVASDGSIEDVRAPDWLRIEVT